MDTLSKIFQKKIITIIRGANPDDFLKIVNALLDGGLNIIEVTLNSPDALSVIKQVSAQMGQQLLMGAGTVMDVNAARAAISAGAKFIISPILNIEVIQATKQLGAVSIP